MVQKFGNAFLQKPAHKAGTATTKIPRLPTGAKGAAHPPAERKLTFTKIIRWRLPDGQTAGAGRGRSRRHVHKLAEGAVGSRRGAGRLARDPPSHSGQPHASLHAARGRQAGPGQALRRHGHSERRAGTTIRHCHRPRPARLHALLADEVNARPAGAIRD